MAARRGRRFVIVGLPTPAPPAAPAEPPMERLLLLAEVATITRVSRSTVRHWIRHGTISSVKLGKRVVVRASELERFISAGERRRRD